MAMFICSFKASKIKILLSVVLCALIATVAIILMPDTEHTVTVNGTQYDKKISFDKIKTTEDMVTLRKISDTRRFRTCGKRNGKAAVNI